MITSPRDLQLPSLEVSDYIRILRLLEDCGRARSPRSFREAVLEGLARHLGYRNTTFFVGETPSLVFRDLAPVATGRAVRMLSAYGGKFHSLDPFAIKARRVSQLGTMPFSLASIADQRRPDHREYLERFLFRSGIHAKVLVPFRHPAGTAVIGVLAEDEDALSVLDIARAMTLAPHLSNLYALQVSPPTPPLSVGLTPRQAEVALMAVNGATNIQIAAALYITVDTVKKHLSSVYNVSGCSSRTQLAALWHSHVNG